MESWDAERGESSFDFSAFENGMWMRHAATLRDIALADVHGLVLPYKLDTHTQLNGVQSEDVDAAILRAILKKQESLKAQAPPPPLSAREGGRRVRFVRQHSTMNGLPSPGSPLDASWAKVPLGWESCAHRVRIV